MRMAKWAKSAAGFAAFLVSLFLSIPQGNAANVVVPSLELVTRGLMTGGVFGLATYGDMDLAFSGGYKFGGSVTFNFLNDFLEQDPLHTSATFEGMSIIVRDLFTLPFNFSWFVGENDLLCEGDAFTTIFGTKPIMTRYRGFQYFPQGVLYDGIHEIKGTGARLDYAPSKESLLFSLYAYEDTHFTQDTLQQDGTTLTTLLPGYFSGDIRMLANLGFLKMDAFFGATYSPVSPLGYYRGGMLFYATNGSSAEFLAQLGVPKYDPSSDPNVKIDLFYLLVEPRLHLKPLSIVFTLFLHPGYYLQKPTGETGTVDGNLDIYLGDLVENGFRAGIESNIQFASTTGFWSWTESPYVSFVIFGILWNCKLDLKAEWPPTWSDISGSIGIKAEF